MKPKKIAPIEARKFNQICTLPRDNLDAGGFWIQLDEGVVTIAKQKPGEPCENSMDIPRSAFDRLARWYVTGKATK